MPTTSGHLSASGVAQITTNGRALQEKSTASDVNSIGRLIGGAGEASARAAAALRDARVQGVYVHVPFCFHKCHYCDFYSIADSQDRQDAFVDRLIREIKTAAGMGVFADGVQTIFVGGGTPTLLTKAQWRRLGVAIRDSIRLVDGGEFTVEMNPETVTPELIDVLIGNGVNRASIGAQSFDARHLKTLERWHDPRNVERSMQILRDAGIANINLDLIFGVPGQSVDDWQRDLDVAIALGPTHVSCYGLMYEPNTALTKRMKAGDITPVADDVEAAMYEVTVERLSRAGFDQYEISNFARLAAGLAPRCATAEEPRVSNHRALAGQAPPLDSGDTRCRHNLLYWRNANWWALGPSASGHVNGLRWKNVPRLGDYLDDARSEWPAITDVEMVDAATAAGEQFMLGLRLIDGLGTADVQRLLALSGERAAERRAAIARHTDRGLLEIADGRLRLTKRGLLLANNVLVDLV